MQGFSPLQGITQRLEEIELIYDELLDDEEGLERKNKKKKRKPSSGSLDIDEEEDYIDSDDIDSDDASSLKSFHNQQLNLNDSTADFNKEIRQINQELQ